MIQCRVHMRHWIPELITHVSCQHIGNYVILADHICHKRSQESEMYSLNNWSKESLSVQWRSHTVKVVIVEIECLSCINFVQMISISWCLVVVRSGQLSSAPATCVASPPDLTHHNAPPVIMAWRHPHRKTQQIS